MEQKKIVIKREELYEQVWSKPMTTLAKEYGLSDVGLAKICKKLNVPKPEAGYWAKVNAGKDVIKMKLPIQKEGENESYELWYEDKNKIGLPDSILLLIESEKNNENKIIVPLKYVRYHKMLNCIVKEKPTKFHSFNPYNSSARNNFGFKITESSLDRSIKIFDALIKALEARKYSVITKEAEKGKNTFVLINGMELKITLSEKLKQMPSKEYDVNKSWSNKYDLLPSGILKLEIGDYYSSYELETKVVRDTPTQRLEDRLNEFVIALLKGSVAKKKWKEDLEKEKILRQKKEEERSALLKEIKVEKGKCEELWSNVDSYYRAYQIRLYIKAVEDDYKLQNGEIINGSKIDHWLKWAYDQADRVDPLKDSPPSVLDHITRYSNWELSQ